MQHALRRGWPHVILVVAAAISLWLIAASAPAAARPPRPDAERLPLVLQRGQVSCRDVRSGEQLEVGYRMQQRVSGYPRDSSGNVQFSHGAPRVVTYEDRTFPIGTIAIGASTCRTAQGWRILADVNLRSNPTGLDAAGRIRGTYPEKGWGATVERIENGRIDVLVAACGERPDALRTLKKLLGLPVPGPFKVTALMWVAGEALPEREPQKACYRVGVVPITLGVFGGRLTAHADELSRAVSYPGSDGFVRYDMHTTITRR